MLIPLDSRNVSTTNNLHVFDKETGQLVMLVLCNFCQHTPLLTHLGDVINRAVQYHRSMRVCFMICLLYETHSLKLADPGKIIQGIFILLFLLFLQFH